MYQTLIHIFDCIFPPSEETLLVRSLTERDCDTLLTARTIDDTIVLTTYSNPRVRALIHEAKFHHSRRALKLLGTLVQLYTAERPQVNDMTIIPVPLSPARLRERGYNQVTEILNEASALHVLTDVLIRTKHSAPQTSVDRTHRETNVKDVFTVRNSHLIAGKKILLVDDVLTTGATLRAAKAALVPHGPASVTCLTIAH